MDDAEYRKMFEYEDTHWWFRGKRAVLARFLDRLVAAPARGLDVGCGTGANLRLFDRYGIAYGVDVSALALDLSRRRGLANLARASAERLPYRDESFDVVTMLDLLYHRRVGDVAASLAEAGRVCRPGGVLIITDSAFEALRGPHDIAYHGARRFRRDELARAVRSIGFTVLKSSYMNAFLFPPALAIRLAERLWWGSGRPRSSLQPPRRVLNDLLAGIFRLEAAVLPHLNLPFGLSVLVVARKPRAA